MLMYKGKTKNLYYSSSQQVKVVSVFFEAHRNADYYEHLFALRMIMAQRQLSRGQEHVFPGHGSWTTYTGLILFQGCTLDLLITNILEFCDQSRFVNVFTTCPSFDAYKTALEALPQNDGGDSPTPARSLIKVT